MVCFAGDSQETKPDQIKGRQLNVIMLFKWFNAYTKMNSEKFVIATGKKKKHCHSTDNSIFAFPIKKLSVSGRRVGDTSGLNPLK